MRTGHCLTDINMTNFCLLLLVIIGGCGADDAVISRSPDGPIIETEQQNVTLHCGLKSGDDGDSVTSVIWYFNGAILTQLPDPQCLDVLDADESSGSGSGDLEKDISEFLEHELGSGEEDEDIDLTGLIDDNFIFDAMREKRETRDMGASDEEGSSDKLYDEEEESGSSEDSEYLDVVRLLCDVDPTTLTLASVTRQFTGDYSCAIIQDKGITEQSSPLEVSVECKLRDYPRVQCCCKPGRFSVAMMRDKLKKYVFDNCNKKTFALNL